MNQTEGIDATSKFQDSLPVSSDMLLQKLVDWQIEYQLFDHVPFKTVVESKKVQSLFRSSAPMGSMWCMIRLVAPILSRPSAV